MYKDGSPTLTLTNVMLFDTYRNAIKSKSFQFELGLTTLLQPREWFHLNLRSNIFYAKQ